MRLLLTGGTGFLGHELLKTLRARGHEVTALVRSASRATAFPAGVRLVEGAVESGAWHGELRGHDAVVHVAAVVKMWARDRREFDRVNVEGTDALVRAALDAGVGRVVYASSFMALGPSNGAPLKEDDPRRTAHTHNDYERTKHLADQVARKWIAEGAPLYVAYPGVIYGPGNLTAGNIVARSVAMILRGLMPVALPLKAWSYSYVDDVVGGFVRLVESTPPSHRYILGGDNRTGAEFHEALFEASGKRPPRVTMPLALAKAAGYGEWLLAEALGREPTLLTHQVADIYARAWAYDSSLAERELGYRVTPLRDGLRRLVEWLRAEGLAP